MFNRLQDVPCKHFVLLGGHFMLNSEGSMPATSPSHFQVLLTTRLHYYMLHTRFNINTMWLQFRALLAHIQCLVVSRSKIRKYVCKLLLEMQIYNHRVVRCVCLCVIGVCERINTFNTHTMWRVGWENTGNLSVARWRPRHGSCRFKAATQ